MSMSNERLQEIIEAAWAEREALAAGRCDPALREAVDEVLARL